jgi:hypothetical protein
MNITYMSNSEMSDPSNLILNCLLHYIQIATIIEITNYELNFQLPYAVTFLPNVVGEPIQSL